MTGWTIECCDTRCGKKTWAANIVELITSHRDEDGWFLCQCGKPGYVKRSFDLQEPGETFEPYLRGAIPLGEEGDTYQPFVFLASNEPGSLADGIWFSYYKDLRSTGGRLKLGHGPGGPPILDKRDLLQLMRKLKDIGCLSAKEIEESLQSEFVAKS